MCAFPAAASCVARLSDDCCAKIVRQEGAPIVSNTTTTIKKMKIARIDNVLKHNKKN